LLLEREETAQPNAVLKDTQSKRCRPARAAWNPEMPVRPVIFAIASVAAAAKYPVKP
jgi:hypothetical protein